MTVPFESDCHISTYLLQSELVKLVDLATQLSLLGQGDNLAQVTMDYLTQGSLLSAHDYLLTKAREIISRITTAPPINLTQANMNVVVNVYGTNDVFNQLGVGAGYRDEIGDYRVGDQ